jgi:hypothetical protein
MSRRRIQLMTTATRKILNTGTNKYQSAFRQMQRAIYSDNTYISLNANTLTTDVKNDLENLNEFWMTSCYFHRVVRDNYRLCFPRIDWQKSTIYDRYDSQETPQTQNAYVFDPTIGDGVLFLCVGNNEFNRTDIRTASVIRPSAGYTNVADLPTTVIQQADGYSWIAVAQSDNRFTDSNWISLEVRDGISFFGGDQQTYIDDGVTLGPFKTAVCNPHDPGKTGAAGFYPVLNSYDQTTESEVDSGSILYSVGNIERFDAFRMQQALKISGVDTKVEFVGGSTTGSTGELPNTTSVISIGEQISNSPFTDSSPLGWYNKKVQGWKSKAGSVEMVYLNTAGLSASALIVDGITAPTVAAKGNGDSPTIEFITRKINESKTEIKGVKISTDLATGNRLVGKNNTRIEFQVSDTGNDDAIENALRAFITPYNGLLTEENLYGPVVPINSFMMSTQIPESDVTGELDFGGGNITGPTSFDSYGLVVNAMGYAKSNYTYERELGLDLPPNKTEAVGNLIYADITPSSGAANLVSGMLIYETVPKVGGTSPRGELIGIIQAVESPYLVGAQYAAISTAKASKFTNGATFYVGSGSSFKLFTQTAKATKVTVAPLTGTLMHIGKSNFDISGGTNKRITVKYITRV